MASSPITSWQIDGETMETMRDFILGGLQITADDDCSHEIKRCLLHLEWPFFVLVVCGSFLLWRFLPVGGIGRLACQDFLVREAWIGVLVGGAGFLLSGVQWSVQ